MLVWFTGDQADTSISDGDMEGICDSGISQSMLHQPASCHVCHKSFANIYRLQRHMISHEESQELRRFKCPDCEKAFKFKHHLKVIDLCALSYFKYFFNHHTLKC